MVAPLCGFPTIIGRRAVRDSQPEQVPSRRPSACSTFGVTVCGFMRCPPPPIASQATACWTRRPYRWRRGGACSEKAQTRDAARMPRWRLEKPMGATPLRVRGAPNSRRHGVHAKRERATLPASPSGGIGWEAGGMARSWNDPDASGSPRGTHFSGWSPKGGYSLGRLPDGQEEPPDNPHVAQRKEQPPPKRQAAGSSPAVGAISCDKSRFSWEARKKRPFIRKKTNQGEMEPPHRWRLARVGLGPWGRPLRSARAIPRAVASAVASRQEKSPSIRQECRGLTTKGGQQ